MRFMVLLVTGEHFSLPPPIFFLGAPMIIREIYYDDNVVNCSHSTFWLYNIWLKWDSMCKWRKFFWMGSLVQVILGVILKIAENGKRQLK